MLLDVKRLKQYFPIRAGIFLRKVADIKAVDDVSLFVNKGETLGIVGESGCGKSTLGRSIIGLNRKSSGQIVFDGTDISELSSKQMRPIRRRIQMIFQDPYSTLNSRHSIGQILREPLVIHKIGDKQTRSKQVRELLDRVGLQRSAESKFPHEFSGGQRQRIGIARAMSLSPELVICDESVSALDVSIQAQILNLLLELQQERSLTYIFISHDLAVVRHMSDRVAVMYAGKIVETTTSKKIYQNPLHPYTRALISAIPVASNTKKSDPIVLSGDVPSPINPPHGCRFHPRCKFAKQNCLTEAPSLKPFNDSGDGDHFVACHYAGKV